MLQEKESQDGVHPSHAGEVNEAVTTKTGPEYEAMFSKISKDGPNYQNASWISTAAFMMKTQIGLGVLSLPAIFNTTGLILGIILILLIAGITTWAQWIISVFKLRHSGIYGIDSIGRLFQEQELQSEKLMTYTGLKARRVLGATTPARPDPFTNREEKPIPKIMRHERAQQHHFQRLW
ncbi:hypothetical protein LA080_008067 [Diaporthe eres]|nr:hypothetical protein LA080_008067 [Diaporthe eres]